MTILQMLEAAPADTPSRPHPEAQRMELRDRWLRAQERYDFMPGDLVQQKRGLGVVRDQERHQLIFWRWLDCERYLDRTMVHIARDRAVATPDMDCFCAMLDDAGSTLLFFLLASNTLEPIDTHAAPP